MHVSIQKLTETKLIGISIEMSIADNKTFELWQQFAPAIQHISNKLNSYKFSVQLYPLHYFDAFQANLHFTKWAAVAVTNFNHVPQGLQTLVLKEGMYAVFNYKGPASDPAVYQFIYGQWIKESDYLIDSRPHFEIMGDRYHNFNADSEEEIWIPVKLKM